MVIVSCTFSLVWIRKGMICIYFIDKEYKISSFNRNSCNCVGDQWNIIVHCWWLQSLQVILSYRYYAYSHSFASMSCLSMNAERCMKNIHLNNLRNQIWSHLLHQDWQFVQLLFVQEIFDSIPMSVRDRMINE